MGDIFQNLVYQQEDIIRFPAGIPGFEQRKEFVLVQIPEYLPFEWLVCTDGSKLRFAIINPMVFLPDYSPNVTKEQLADLQFEKPEDILLYTIVTIRDNPADSTANLIGPLFINRTRRLGKQVIIDDDRYSTKENILRKS
ncbi:MAG: flagellar assembly protein FliW [Chitinispirillaceae bacterium]